MTPLPQPFHLRSNNNPLPLVSLLIFFPFLSLSLLSSSSPLPSGGAFDKLICRETMTSAACLTSTGNNVDDGNGGGGCDDDDDGSDGDDVEANGMCPIISQTENVASTSRPGE